MRVNNLIGKFFIAIMLSILIVSLIPVSASADIWPYVHYSYSGWYWDTDLVYYDDGALDGTWRWELWQASYTWNNAGADFSMIQATNNSNHDWDIGYVEYAWRIAQTTVTYSGNIISDCDTRFNDDYDFSVGGSTGTYDIQSVALHEFGHWLCLLDLGWPNNAKVMGYLEEEEVKQSLHHGDILGIQYIYP